MQNFRILTLIPIRVTSYILLMISVTNLNMGKFSGNIFNCFKYMVMFECLFFHGGGGDVY